MNTSDFEKMEKKISEAEKLLAEQKEFLHRIAEEEGAESATPRAGENANLSTPSPDTDILKRALFARIEDEYDVAVAEEAYQEYLDSGCKSTLAADFWKELDSQHSEGACGRNSVSPID